MSQVINMFEARKKIEEEASEEVAVETSKEKPEGYDFESIMTKNQANKNRVKAQRAKDNASVTRSYRLK